MVKGVLSRVRWAASDKSKEHCKIEINVSIWKYVSMLGGVVTCGVMLWLVLVGGRWVGTRRLMNPGRKKLKKECFSKLEISPSVDVFMHRRVTSFHYRYWMEFSALDERFNLVTFSNSFKSEIIWIYYWQKWESCEDQFSGERMQWSFWSHQGCYRLF